MTPLKRQRALPKIARMVATLALTAGVAVGLASPSSAVAKSTSLLPKLSTGVQAPGAQAPKTPGKLTPMIAGSDTLVTKVLAEWNFYGALGCAHDGCQWLFEPDPRFQCEVHHIIPQNDPAAALARYYAAVGGYSTEDLANGVYLIYAAHKDTFGAVYTAFQNAEFEAFGNLPNGHTAAGARFYTGEYLGQMKHDLWFHGGPAASPGGCPGIVFWPA